MNIFYISFNKNSFYQNKNYKLNKIIMCIFRDFHVFLYLKYTLLKVNIYIMNYIYYDHNIFLYKLKRIHND